MTIVAVADVPEIEDVATMTFCPGVRFDAVKLGVKGNPGKSEDSSGATKVVELPTTTVYGVPEVSELPRACCNTRLKLLVGLPETEVTGPVRIDKPTGDVPVPIPVCSTVTESASSEPSDCVDKFT